MFLRNWIWRNDSSQKVGILADQPDENPAAGFVFIPPTSTKIIHQATMQPSPALGQFNEEPTDGASLPLEDKDALANFQKELAEKLENYNLLLKQWMAKKSEIPGQSIQSVDSHVNTSYLEAVSHVFTFILEKMKALVVSANWELSDVINDVEPHIKKLNAHLNDVYKKLETELSQEERERLCVDICDTSILILNDLIKLVDNTSSEINYCLRTEELGEMAAKRIAQFACLALLKISLPEAILNFEMKDMYRNIVDNEIIEEKEEIEAFSSEEERVLNNASTVLNENLAKKTRHHDWKDVSSTVSLSQRSSGLYRIPIQNVRGPLARCDSDKALPTFRNGL